MALPDPTPPKHVIVIGAGLAGLAASYDLIRSGYRVTLLEMRAELGGLASSSLLEGRLVEQFYHFICRSDHELIDLSRELGIEGQIHWRNTSTGFYYEGATYPFGTPFDLIRFSPIPWMQRLRFGIHILNSRYRSQWRWLDQIPATPWLIENIGEQAYNVIWHPLLKVKFGDQYDKISAAWIWHRIWRVATSRKNLFSREMFGYLENGSFTLVNSIAARLRSHPGFTLLSGKEAQAIEIQEGRVTAVQIPGQRIPCDAVLSTVATPIVAALLPALDEPYFTKLRQIQSIGVVCMILSLKSTFSPYYWLNVNDQRIPYNGMIELTNLNQHLKNEGMNILYIPLYLPVSDPRYTASDQALFEEYVQTLKVIKPGFDVGEIKEWHVYRAPYAQAICTTHFSRLIPDLRSPVRGLYITDSTQFYPEDRTLSAAIRQGRKAASLIQEENG